MQYGVGMETVSSHVVWEPGGVSREVLDDTCVDLMHAVDAAATRGGRAMALCGVHVTVLPRSWDTVGAMEKCVPCQAAIDLSPVETG